MSTPAQRGTFRCTLKRNGGFRADRQEQCQSDEYEDVAGADQQLDDAVSEGNSGGGGHADEQRRLSVEPRPELAHRGLLGADVRGRGLCLGDRPFRLAAAQRRSAQTGFAIGAKRRQVLLLVEQCGLVPVLAAADEAAGCSDDG